MAGWRWIGVDSTGRAPDEVRRGVWGCRALDCRGSGWLPPELQGKACEMLGYAKDMASCRYAVQVKTRLQPCCVCAFSNLQKHQRGSTCRCALLLAGIESKAL